MRGKGTQSIFPKRRGSRGFVPERAVGDGSTEDRRTSRPVPRRRVLSRALGLSTGPLLAGFHCCQKLNCIQPFET